MAVGAFRSQRGVGGSSLNTSRRDVCGERGRARSALSARHPPGSEGHAELTLRSQLVSIVLSLIAVLLLAGIHAGAGAVRRIPDSVRPTVASAAAGISVAWVFLELLPSLTENQETVVGSGLLPGMERHVYVAALLGLVISFWVETASRSSRRRSLDAGGEPVTSVETFWLSLAGFAVFNASIGYALADPADPAVSPFWIFVIAMGLHFVANDESLVENHGLRYERVGRWLLVGGLLAGWVIGAISRFDLDGAALALVLSLIAGGMIMNIIRHELPETSRTVNVAAFALGALVLGVLVLAFAPAAVTVG
jgi:hypothetical protein